MEATETGTRLSRPPRRRPTNIPAEAAPRTHIASAQIAHRAYELFLQRGGVHGHDLEDWLAAESELREKSSLES